ncbi:hypothetical protein Emin_0935 [Elusimicrobium minutum Pei191]|uniref:Uncharacterized protein n=1 Tax=Elusimicrobium minutum (strain Pei191) TaxID=445932 RepID=B2KD92_ELUMP|nr:hypothetical protein [Elusimicrobium minutum]ACC98488.1 hypothetical protein Emin_0935 [Elusimicrobium minutum Pei191]
MKNEKIIILVLFGVILFGSGCCPAVRTPATVQNDIERLRVYNQRLEAENEYLTGKFSELTSAAEEYAGGVSQVAGESLSDLDRLQANNTLLGNCIQRILTDLSERNNKPENPDPVEPN